MIENFGLIKDRISAYTYVPDRQFRTSSGRSIEEVTTLKTAMTVILALQERAQFSRTPSLIDTRV
ncbi:hypothetical protein [Pseudomonas sp. UMAB-08]|uniref:hypothetical protein n=1 Tax=Pseudomonas sp. UMAB-08 TaxID=1365375 RepID=UPI001C55F9C8|nr:hypothetical protein [Pseudomonas sp. UMAB-08]